MSPPLPVLSGADTIKALEKLGFVRVSQKGSHVKARRARLGHVRHTEDTEWWPPAATGG